MHIDEIMHDNERLWNLRGDGYWITRYILDVKRVFWVVE